MTNYPDQSVSPILTNLPRSTSWRLDLLITLLGLLGLFLFLAFYDQAFPSAAIELELSRSEITQRAQTYLATRGYNLDGYEFALSFQEDGWASAYLQQTLGIAETNRLIRAERLPIWTWRARWFRPLQKEEFSVLLLPDSQVVGFVHSLPEEEAGARLRPEEAQTMAEAYLVDNRHLNVADWELVTASSKEQPGARIDHNFEWKGRHLSIGDGDLRLSVTIKGDEVGAYNVWLRVPETFERRYAEQRGRAGFFNDLSFMSGAVGFGLAGLLAFLIAVWQGSQRWYAGLRPALAIAAVALFAGLNRLPLATTGYQTTQDYTLFWLQQIFDLLYLSGLIAAMIFVTWPGGKSLSKQVWSHRDKILPRQGDRWETLARSSWRGLMLGGIRSGYGVIFYLVVTQLLGGWVPLDNPYTALFATPLPFLGPLAGGLIPAMSEELLFRLVGISLILWLTGRRWLALLVPGVLWAFAHLAYVRDPFYLRGLELTVVAVLYGLFFLRFDLTTVVVAHFTYNASLGILPLIRSGEPYFVASGLIIIAAMLAPVLPSLVRTVRRRRRQIPDRPLPQIRLADSNDLKAIARLPVETLDWSTLITDPDSALLCLQSSDELAGFVAGRVTAEGHSEVLAIYVAPGWRRRYWGSRLVEALRAGLAARGGVSVQVTVSADDRVCTAFWASQGWRPAVKRFTSSLTAPAHPHWRGLLKQLKTVFRQ